MDFLSITGEVCSPHECGVEDKWIRLTILMPRYQPVSLQFQGIYRSYKIEIARTNV